MKETQNTRPNVAAYRDYRAWLRDMIVYLKATRRGFSYRSFSRTAGFSSPNFLKQVADGKRNLSTASIARFARGLGLDDHEHSVFEALVLLDQAATDDERNHHYRRLRSVVKMDDVARIEADQYELYSRWYTVVVRELVALKGFVDEPGWIARRLLPRIRPHQAQTALELLERLKLIARDGQGRRIVADRQLSTGPRVRSLAIRNFHRLMLELASRALDTVPAQQRDVTSLTLPLTEAKYDRARELIGELRRSILALSDEPGDSNAPEEIYQIELAMFPVSKESER